MEEEVVGEQGYGCGGGGGGGCRRRSHHREGRVTNGHSGLSRAVQLVGTSDLGVELDERDEPRRFYWSYLVLTVQQGTASCTVFSCQATFKIKINDCLNIIFLFLKKKLRPEARLIH